MEKNRARFLSRDCGIGMTGAPPTQNSCVFSVRTSIVKWSNPAEMIGDGSLAKPTTPRIFVTLAGPSLAALGEPGKPLGRCPRGLRAAAGLPPGLYPVRGLAPSDAFALTCATDHRHLPKGRGRRSIQRNCGGASSSPCCRGACGLPVGGHRVRVHQGSGSHAATAISPGKGDRFLSQLS